MTLFKTGLLAATCAAVLGGPAAAQLALSGNDNKAVLDNGVTRIVQNPAPDTVALLDLGANPPAMIAEAQVPHSVVGPPYSVAISPNGLIGLVSSNQKIDPANPARTIPDNRLTVLDLSNRGIRVVGTLETGAGPAGISFNRAGTLALVANRAEGTISVFRVRDGQVTPLGKVTVGNAASEVSHVAFTPDGTRALVTRNGDNSIGVLEVAGETVTVQDRQLTPGVRPYGLSIASHGRAAVVANIGRGTGDADTISVIDLAREPYRVVETISVGQTPEGIELSPDGRFVAVTVMNGSNKPQGSPFLGTGLVRVYRLDGTSLRHHGDATVGGWAQGAAFSSDGRRLFVQNMVERNIQVLEITEQGVRDTGQKIAMSGGPAAIRIAEPTQ
ncbi:YncE family protein [Humitalea sp. 24SJ18S-53]|uniref:YncE family protein n=1 Tax=Humitalea sp. 24SJ18S-53 TaxID=3422307 RepID=UPI003D67A96D